MGSKVVEEFINVGNSLEYSHYTDTVQYLLVGSRVSI